MTALQTFTTVPTALSDLDPYRFPAVFDHDLPEEPRTAQGVMDMDAGDYMLPAPAPASRLPLPLAPEDRRRLDLHAALTTAGIAPLPGDLDAIEALCRLDDTTHTALQRWITHTV
ncbi:hypothetical protein [Streptomyces sp. NPDC006551]|uniref:hypothetical protein n=1 Tax=Streptomyces sp. NPDC006551 TaxID=3157178 RepID=UPI0033B0699E